MNKFLKYWLVVIIWAGFIFFLSHQPYLATSFPKEVDLTLRKLAHLVEFFILNLLISRALIQDKRISLGPIISSSCLSLAYAFSDEYHQGFIAGRQPALEDVAIDGLGIVLAGVVLIFIWLKAKKVVK